MKQIDEKSEFNQARWDNWGSRKRPIDEFSLRIQKDLQTIPFPDIKKLESIYYWGDVGTGKTIKAIHMMLSYPRMNYAHCIIDNNWKFITVPELLIEIKKTYLPGSFISEFDVLDKYSEAEFLVLDDFGVEKTTDWTYQLLYTLINRRYENMKYTVITSNLSLEELAEKLDDERLTSRIKAMCTIVECTKQYR